MARVSKSDRAEAIARLQEIVKPGMTVYTTLRHVSRSGMSRVIDLHVIVDGEMRWIGYLAAKAMGDSYDDRRQGIKVPGCGMDMGFHIVHCLAYTLHGMKGVNVPEDARNAVQAREPGATSYSAGYSIRHEWL